MNFELIDKDTHLVLELDEPSCEVWIHKKGILYLADEYVITGHECTFNHKLYRMPPGFVNTVPKSGYPVDQFKLIFFTTSNEDGLIFEMRYSNGSD